MTLRTFIAASSVCILAGASLAAAQATLPDNSHYSREKKLYRESVLQYPLLKQHKIDEVLRIHLDDGQLVVEPVLEADREYQERRAELEGLAEPAKILCWLLSQDLGQVQFELSVENYTDPLVMGRLHLQARPAPNDTSKLLARLDIEKIWDTPTGHRRVFFTQADNSAELIISGEENGAGQTDRTLTERDFATLRQKHHADTERWLRPILRELHQESVFAADPAAAWQVLASDWPLDEKMRPAIAAQLSSLDDDDFRVRLRAADELEKLGRDGALVIMRMDRAALSPEQSLRLDEVVSRFEPLTWTTALRLRNNPGFLLDCLYGDDAIARKLALNRLREMTGKPIPFDLNGPPDARVIAVNALREKLLGEGIKRER
jgi:hypothetical protein